MDERGGLLGLRFSPMEVLGGAFSLAAMAVSITLWSIATFQSKQDAVLIKAELEKRIESVEGEVQLMRQSLESVAKDVSYIRGRIEPKSD